MVSYYQYSFWAPLLHKHMHAYARAIFCNNHGHLLSLLQKQTPISLPSSSSSSMVAPSLAALEEFLQSAGLMIVLLFNGAAAFLHQCDSGQSVASAALRMLCTPFAYPALLHLLPASSPSVPHHHVCSDTFLLFGIVHFW